MSITRWMSHSSLVVLVCTFAWCAIQTLAGDPAFAQSGRAMRADSEVKQTAWPSIPLPKITLPTVTMPDMSVITAPVKSGYGKVSEGTRRAWEGTKEMFTFGQGNSAPAARSQPQPSFWKRMFTSEPEKNDGPQTVGEWMAQPRL